MQLGSSLPASGIGRLGLFPMAPDPVSTGSALVLRSFACPGTSTFAYGIAWTDLFLSPLDLLNLGLTTLPHTLA